MKSQNDNTKTSKKSLNELKDQEVKTDKIKGGGFSYTVIKNSDNSGGSE